MGRVQVYPAPVDFTDDQQQGYSETIKRILSTFSQIGKQGKCVIRHLHIQQDSAHVKLQSHNNIRATATH